MCRLPKGQGSDAYTHPHEALNTRGGDWCASCHTAHNTALATERKQTMTYQERAERAEWKAKGLEAQVNGLLRGQRS
jgi:hypothetical protein